MDNASGGELCIIDLQNNNEWEISRADINAGWPSVEQMENDNDIIYVDAHQEPISRFKRSLYFRTCACGCVAMSKLTAAKKKYRWRWRIKGLRS